MAAVTVLTAPTAYPVALQELRTHIRLTGDDGSHNTLLQAAIYAAVAMFERRTNRALIRRKLRLTLDAFPAGGLIHLPRPPALIDDDTNPLAIAYLDADGASQTLDASDYTTDAAHEPARVQRAPNAAWPTTRKAIAAVTVDYWAGYGADGADVPADIRQALLMLAAHFYENPEATTQADLAAVPLAVGTILESYWIPEEV